MAKKEKGNGAAQADRADMEPPHDGNGVALMAPPLEPGETLPDGTAGAAEAQLTSQCEPGPEDFERHGGARLLADQGADMRLQDEVERRLRKRGDVIAKRLRKSGVNATAEINGVEYVARQRPKCPGEMMLSEVPTLVKSTLDP